MLEQNRISYNTIDLKKNRGEEMSRNERRREGWRHDILDVRR